VSTQTQDSASRMLELKSVMDTKMEENDRIAGTFTTEDNGGIVVSSEQRDAFRANLADIEEVKGLIDDLQAMDTYREYGDAAPASVAMQVAAGAQGGALAAQYTEAKSLGEQFTASDEFKSLIATGGATMQRAWEVAADMTGLSVKDIYTGLAPAATSRGFGRTQVDPMVMRQHRTTRVRDMFPSIRTTANLIDFYRVTGFTEGGSDGALTPGGRGSASNVPERDGSAFGLKPQSNLNFSLGQAPVRTIAHFEVAHRNVLADEPQLQAVINNELMYGLRLQEDDQLLNGDGVGENLLGILQVDGIQTYNRNAIAAGATNPGPNTSLDTLRRATTRTILSYYESTGIVLHPLDWEGIELDKDSESRYILTTNIAVGGEKRVWRQPVVETPAIAQATYVLGAFGLGAQVYDREQSNIRIAEQHSDFFIRNAVAILAEERIALAVKRPEAFVTGSLVPAAA
jgi:HK97 family phage major capsid protein